MATKESQTAHLDTTIKVIEEHVKKETISGVPNTINSWIKTLEEHRGLSGIANDLKKLKDAISEKDGKNAVTLMTKLGADVTKAAENSEDEEASKIKQLGKTLTTAAKTLGKLV